MISKGIKIQHLKFQGAIENCMIEVCFSLMRINPSFIKVNWPHSSVEREMFVLMRYNNNTGY